ncbi:TniQ family protein [Sphingomonas olei]|uniref:TniQ domain-containing protein n=1 Tax=Sphingomonas olei TaxID=1886787 RepID=A0ABY2QIL2_9SPHN|nr:TniQ family protein [Sphingomonas olei]THG40654.1 hypothetical protein E5988_07550 [Sphingomonas olei]
MPLAFLPQFHPDELLYSVVARYGRWGRLRTGRVNENLFGTKSIKFSYDLPLQIGRLADTVGLDLPLTVSDIVRDHTLLPFHTALRERGEYDELARRMIAGENIQRTLKGTRAVLPWPDRLRYCPECDDVSRRLYGTPIWLRRHQLVTSLICLEHGGILLASDVDVTWGRDMTYRPASDHRGDAQAIAFPFSGEAMMRYRDITSYGHSMLGSQDHRNVWSPETDFKALARRKGFIVGKHVDMVGLIAEFDHHFGDVLSLWPRLQSFEGRKGLHWIYGLFSGLMFKNQPVCRALVTTFLEAREDGSGADAARRLAHKSTAKPPRPEMKPQARALRDDDKIVEEIRAVGERLRRKTPPARVTQGMLTRGVPGLQSMLQTYPLPRTRAALIEEAETHATFTPRKLRWMFEEAARRGEVISLSKLLGRRLFIDRDLVRSEWKRYYEGSGRGETSGSTAG